MILSIYIYLYIYLQFIELHIYQSWKILCWTYKGIQSKSFTSTLRICVVQCYQQSTNRVAQPLVAFVVFHCALSATLAVPHSAARLCAVSTPVASHCLWVGSDGSMSMSMFDFRLGLFISLGFVCGFALAVGSCFVCAAKCRFRFTTCVWVCVCVVCVCVWVSVCQTFTCTTVIYALPYLIWIDFVAFELENLCQIYCIVIARDLPTPALSPPPTLIANTGSSHKKGKGKRERVGRGKE